MSAHRVFVVNEPMRYNPNDGHRSIDLSPAYEFGDLVFLSPPGNPPLDPDYITQRMRELLVDFTSNDFLLPIGHPVLIGWATALAAQRAGGRIKMLHWLRQYLRYTVIEAILWIPEQESRDEPVTQC